jgi:uncharacterized SAM-binding protein YcdF (DUF218 family)
VVKERINHGIWLYMNGYVEKLIFTGGFGAGSEYSEAWVARKYAVEQGVAAADIFIEEKSVITIENIFYAAEIVRENGIEAVIIVSDPLHMKRAMLIARDNGLMAYSSPTPTTRYVSLRTKVPFLVRETVFYLGHRVAK